MCTLCTVQYMVECTVYATTSNTTLTLTHCYAVQYCATVLMKMIRSMPWLLNRAKPRSKKTMCATVLRVLYLWRKQELQVVQQLLYCTVRTALYGCFVLVPHGANCRHQITTVLSLAPPAATVLATTVFCYCCNTVLFCICSNCKIITNKL